MPMSLSEEERVSTIKTVSIAYTRLAKQRQQLRQKLELYRERNYMRGYLIDLQRQIDALTDEMVSLDISLGFLVIDENDRVNIPEYDEALKH